MAERNNLASTMRAMATNLERTPLDAKIEVVETACLKRGRRCSTAWRLAIHLRGEDDLRHASLQDFWDEPS